MSRSQSNVTEGSVNLALLQNSGQISNLVLFYTQRGQRLPLPISDVREMVFGSLPTTDVEATKLHILPAGILSSTGGVTDRPLVTLTKLFTFRVQKAPSGKSALLSSSSSSMSSQQTQKRYVMALVLLIQPKVSKTSETLSAEEYRKIKIFISRHFMTLDLRMCKAARKVRNHVMKLSELGTRIDLGGKISPINQIPQGLSQQHPLTSSSGMRGTNFLIALQNDPEIAHEIDTLKDNIQNLLYGPKIDHPVWLGIVGWSSMHKYFGRGESKGKRIFATNSPEAVIFLNRLCDLESYNTPRWNNFVAAAVTAVLSTHRAWVGTVSTEVSEDALQEASHRQLHIYGGSTIFRNYIEKQLGDLLGGSLGGPLARAAIVGKNVPVIEALLDVLSFFMRTQSFLINTSAMKGLYNDPAQTKLAGFSLDSEENSLSSLAMSAAATSINVPPQPSSSSATLSFSPSSPPPSTSSSQQDGVFNSPQNPLVTMPRLVQNTGNDGTHEAISPLARQSEDVRSLPGGASLNVIPLEDRNDHQADVRVMAGSAEGPARALYGGVYEHFQPDLALMGVTEPYERVLDALYEELQFEQELYSEYLGPGDTPVAVLGDFAGRAFELVTIVPPEEDGADSGQHASEAKSSLEGRGGVKASLESPKKEHGRRGSKKEMQTLDSSYTNEKYMKTAGTPQVQRQGMRRTTIFPSTHVLNTLETAKSLWRLGISADTCIMHIEDRLHEIVSMAKVLMEYLRISPSVPSREQVEAELQLGPGDLSLIASLIQGSKKWPLV